MKVHIQTKTGVETWEDEDERTYTWAVGMAGEVIIYYKVVHKVISNAEMDAGIVRVYAPGAWSQVDVVPE
jgi:hypothetical protein